MVLQDLTLITCNGLNRRVNENKDTYSFLELSKVAPEFIEDWVLLASCYNPFFDVQKWNIAVVTP